MNCKHGTDISLTHCDECIVTIPTRSEYEADAYDRGVTDGANAAIRLIVANLRARAGELYALSQDEEPFTSEWLHLCSSATEATEMAERIERGEMRRATGKEAA